MLFFLDLGLLDFGGIFRFCTKTMRDWKKAEMKACILHRNHGSWCFLKYFLNEGQHQGWPIPRASTKNEAKPNELQPSPAKGIPTSTQNMLCMARTTPLRALQLVTHGLHNIYQPCKTMENPPVSVHLFIFPPRVRVVPTTRNQ